MLGQDRSLVELSFYVGTDCSRGFVRIGKLLGQHEQKNSREGRIEAIPINVRQYARGLRRFLLKTG